MANTAKSTKKSTKKSPAAKSAKKKAPTKGPAGKKSTAKKAVAKKVATKKSAAKKAPAKKPAKKKVAAKKPVKSPFDKKFLDEMHESLLSERSRYLVSAETLKAEADELVESREPGDVQFDEESGEGDTLAVERERDLALSAHARAAVEQINEALDRLENGTYGVCVASAKAIPKERLRAIPWAAERVEYKAGGFGIQR